MLQRNPSAATAVREEETTSTVEVYSRLTEDQPEEPTVTLPLDPEQPTPGADILETSLVESGVPLNLNPFPSDDKDKLVGGAQYT